MTFRLLLNTFKNWDALPLRLVGTRCRPSHGSKMIMRMICFLSRLKCAIYLLNEYFVMILSTSKVDYCSSVARLQIS